MATPTISEYTAHLRQDKATMRDHLLSANITTKESDTFTDLTRIALEKGNAIRRIYVQPDEPTVKYGLWFKRDAVEDFDVVSDPVPFVGDTLSAFNASYNPDAAYDKVKETKVVRANNTIYYLAVDNHKDSYPDESFRIYQYDPYTNTYTKIQTYTANEVYNVRGDGGYYAISVFRKNGVFCIDSEGEYLYLICGGYDTTSESQKYITRFGLKTHSAARVHTKLSNWFPIPAGDLSNAQIVDNKIYIFGQSTNAAAYGNSWNTRIIDLNTGSESTLNHGPVAYQGRTIKVNSHLIAGFGGGNGSMNSGQGMTDVRLFDTLTNTSTLICRLTNENNSRVLTVVGNLIYFVEYRNSGNSSKSVGYVNLSDKSVTYIDDVFTPRLQNIATSSSLYLPSARAIVLGNYIGQTYSYNLDTKPYDKDTVVLFQSTGIAAQYVVDLFTTNNFKTDVPFNISDAWFYKAGSGLETTGEVYYGNGVEWLPLIHGNTNGGVNALQLQHKTVEITEAGVTHVTPDAGFEGLRYIDVDCKVEAKEDLTEELTTYNAVLTEQNITIQDILKVLDSKVPGGIRPVHEQLEYLNCGGKYYFELPIKFNQNTGIEIKFSREDKWEYIAGVWSTATNNVYNLSAMPANVNNGRFEGYYGKNGNESESYHWLFRNKSKDAILVAKGRNWALYDHNMNLLGSHTFNALVFETPINAYVCGVNVYESNGTTRSVGFNGKFYYAKIYDGDVLLYDLIPVTKRNGSIALYDKVTGTYLENLGTGESL